MKEQYKQNALYIAYYQQRDSESTNCSKYCWDVSVRFSQRIILKRSTKGAITSFLLLS